MTWRVEDGENVSLEGMMRARIRAALDGKIIPLKITRPLPSRLSSQFPNRQLEDGCTLADCNI
jgi:hypothetical protein